MSCNGCRILRKGCSDTCILRPSLQLIESAEAQAHATVFVAKFFGRAGLMSFISAVPENQRPTLFQSLLFEAAGRTVNPVSGAVGLLWSGNWHVCQAAVRTVLRGGALHPIPGFPDFDCTDIFSPEAPPAHRKRPDAHLDLSLTPAFLPIKYQPPPEKQRLGTSSINSQESVMTSCGGPPGAGVQILKLFN